MPWSGGPGGEILRRMAKEREVVRQRITLRASGRRRVVERLFLRFPALRQRLTRFVLRRRPTSTIRRGALRLSVRWAVEAANRRDQDAAFAWMPPDYETITPPELVSLGFESIYRGRAERVHLQLAWESELGEFEQELEEIIDTGDHLIVLGRMMGTGLGSGASFNSEVSYAIEIADGRLEREHFFRSHAEALEAAGLTD
jgi:ketosteroid isomerase-like protein